MKKITEYRIWAALQGAAVIAILLAISASVGAQVPIYTRPSALSSGGGTITGPICGSAAFAPCLDLGNLTAGLVAVQRSDAPANNYVVFGSDGSNSVVGMTSLGNIFWTSSATLASGGTRDLILARDAADTLAQRRSTNAQTFRVYNTTDAGLTNYERASLAWSGNQLNITTEQGGTGVSRTMRIYTIGTASLQFGANNTIHWNIPAAGHLTAVTDNAIDIGASGASRPRFLYLGSALRQVGGVTTAGLTGVAAVVATPRVTAQAAASANLGGAYTVGAADGSFEVSGNILITTATTHSINMTVAYTDEGNTARTVTLSFSTLAGVISNAAITNVAGAVPYAGAPLHIRARAATTITCATVGTFTTVVYNAECIIKQMS